MKNKIIGLAVVSTILTTGMIGCRQTAIDDNQNTTRKNMERIQYEVRHPNEINRNTRLGTQPYYGDRTIRNYDTRPFDERNVGLNNQGQNLLPRAGDNNPYTQNNGTNNNINKRIGDKNTGITLAGNTIVIPSRITRNANNTTYVNVTHLINQVTPLEQANQPGGNYSRVNTNNNLTNGSTPMYTMTLPNSVCFIGYNENNPNTIVVRDVSKPNSDTRITLNNNERLILGEGGQTLMPLSTLNKILAVKTSTNPNPLNCEVRNF